jgi:hypothetical protein
MENENWPILEPTPPPEIIEGKGGTNKMLITVIVFFVIIISGGIYLYINSVDNSSESDFEESEFEGETAPSNSEQDIETIDSASLEGSENVSSDTFSQKTDVLDSDVQKLLTLKAGEVNQVTSRKIVEILESKKDVVRSSVNSLLGSNDLDQQIMGVFLYLELYGLDTAITNYAEAKSFYTRAIFANWAYEQKRFSEWDSFLNKTIKNLSHSEIKTILKQLDNRGGTLDLPPSIYGFSVVSNSYEKYYKEILTRNDLAIGVAKELIIKEELGYGDSGNGGDILLRYLSRTNQEEEVISALKKHITETGAVDHRFSFFAQRPVFGKTLEERVHEETEEVLNGGNSIDYIELVYYSDMIPDKEVLFKIRDSLHDNYISKQYYDSYILEVYLDALYLIYKFGY